jgi:hypothetical protein
VLAHGPLAARVQALDPVRAAHLRRTRSRRARSSAIGSASSSASLIGA